MIRRARAELDAVLEHGRWAGGTTTARLLVVFFVLFCELLEALDDRPRVGAIVDVNRWRSHPRLKIVDAQRYVLRVSLNEN